MEELVQLAETQGPEAALQWVKKQQQQQSVGSPKAGSMGVGFTSPPATNNNTMTPTATRRRISSRILTPHPTRRNPTTPAVAAAEAAAPENETPDEVERRLIHHFREAVKYVPHEFSSEIANFTVRRPYGMDQEQDQSNNNSGTLCHVISCYI